MQKYRTLLVMGIMGLFNFQNTFAGNVPGAFTVTLSDAYFHFDEKQHLDNSAMPNIALGYNFTPHWAMEAAAGVLHSVLHTDSDSESVHGGFYHVDGIYRFKPLGHLEPYFLAGIGLLTINPNGVDTEHPGVINAGLGAQLFWGPTVALRLEARDVYQTTGNSNNDYMINLGVSFLFGGS